MVAAVVAGGPSPTKRSGVQPQAARLAASPSAQPGWRAWWGSPRGYQTPARPCRASCAKSRPDSVGSWSWTQTSDDCRLLWTECTRHSSLSRSRTKLPPGDPRLRESARTPSPRFPGWKYAVRWCRCSLPWLLPWAAPVTSCLRPPCLPPLRS
ncbi:uncharacterized protein LOC144722838 [Lampetra planeri]